MPTRRRLLFGTLAAFAFARRAAQGRVRPASAVMPLALANRRFLPGIAADPMPAPTEPGVVFDAASGRSLRVIAREEWGADESIRFDASGGERWPRMFVPVRIVVVHHTATRNSYRVEDVPAELRSIQYYHTVIQGWGDIVYNAVIDRFGNIYEGRHGRGGDHGDPPGPREVLGHSIVAGHSSLHEYGSAGVALLGDATQDDWEMSGPSGPMWDALVRYCSFESGRQFVAPLVPAAASAGAYEAARSDFLQSDNHWDDGVAHVTEHRAIEQTFCPGDPVIALLPALRVAVFAAATGTSRSGVRLTRVAPAGRECPAGTTVSFRWAIEPLDPGWLLAGYEFAVEGWYKPEDKEPIDYLSGYTAEPQPRLAWSAAGPAKVEHSFVAGAPGQYTMHVRAVISRSGTLRRAAYRASETILVRP